MPRKPTGKPTGRPKGGGRLGEVMRLTVRIPLGLYDRLDTYAAGRSFTRGTPQLAECVREALELYLDTKRQTKIIPLLSSESKSQPESEPASARDEIQQTKSVLLGHGDTLQQTISDPELSLEPAAQRRSQPAHEQVSSTPVMLDAMPLEPETGSAVRGRQPVKRTPRERLDAEDLANFDLEAMPLEPGTASATLVRQTAKSPTPLVPGPAFDPHKALLGSPCKAGHRSHGEAGNLRVLVGGACVACATEKKAAKAKAPRPVPVTKEE